MKTDLKMVLVVGSAPDALRASAWDTSCFAHRVVINNAWRACPSWDCWIYPEDFPLARHPLAAQTQGKQLVTAQAFVPVQNRYGGFVYAGGTMAFTAGYWALGDLKPDVLAFLGCDMVYADPARQATHFYGHGTADPLRQDVTLQSLEAKSQRLWALARRQGCAVVNLSDQSSSRLLYPRLAWSELQTMSASDVHQWAAHQGLDEQAVDRALAAEAELAYMVPNGRYWEVASTLNKNRLSQIDQLWLNTLPSRALASA